MSLFRGHMPIDIEMFNKARNKRILILEFLFNNRTKAFSIDEISTSVGFSQLGVSITEQLKHLVNVELVYQERIHQDDYYAISDKGIELFTKDKE
jgi:predicted transcriptional regulator